MVTEAKRRPGRPPLDRVQTEGLRLSIRLTPEERHAIRKAAAEADMSMGEWARRTLLDHVNAPE